MQVLTHWTDVDPSLRGASVAMGNFDGVHRGHQAVIDLARRADRPLGVITFEPHPRQVFAPDSAPFRLMNAEGRRNRMARLGVEVVFELPFSRDLAALTAEEFAQQVLAEGLGIAHVVVGADFCFGRGRKGDARLLRDLGADLGFEVTIMPLSLIHI